MEGFVLPGISIDGKNEGEHLVITSYTSPDSGTVVQGLWIVEGEGPDAQAMFICDVIGDAEYQRLYDFFSPMSDGDVQL